jgi:hypothetical protein
MAALAQDETTDFSKLNNATLMVVGQKAFVGVPGVTIRQGKLVIPIRPVAERLLTELIIDSNRRYIQVLRADDRAVLIYDGRTNTLRMSGFNLGIVPDAALIDWTPGEEAVPQSLLERLLNCFVTVDVPNNIVNVSTNSTAFGEAIDAYEDEVAQNPPEKQKFQLPEFKLNALSYDSVINSNTISYTGQGTTGRFNAEYGRTLINGYGQFIGSQYGPGWVLSMGGVAVTRPNAFNFEAGAYSLRTGSYFANGIANGFVLEKIHGRSTRVGIQIGRVQTSTQFVGFQTQRPVFGRNDVLFYLNVDSRDFRHRAPFWKDQTIKFGSGVGSFQDMSHVPPPLIGPSAPGFAQANASITPQRGDLGYFFARDDIKRLGGNLLAQTDFDAGYSGINNNTEIPHNYFHGGTIFIFRQNTTLFKRLTISTLVQRGAPNWTTLDISRVYRDLLLYNQGLNFQVAKGVTTFVQRSFQKTTEDQLAHQPINLITTGISISKYPNYLPEVSFTTNLIPAPNEPTQFFNTMTLSQNVGFLRTKINSQWLLSNNGITNASSSAASMTSLAPVIATATGVTGAVTGPTTASTTSQVPLQYLVLLGTRTMLWRDFAVTYLQEFSNPQLVLSQVGLETGQLFGDKIRGNFGIGKLTSPGLTQNNLYAGLSVYCPWIRQRVNVNLTKSLNLAQNAKPFDFVQVIVGLSAYVGRGSAGLSTFNVPGVQVKPKGTLKGRFYVDTNLDGIYTPGVDIPLPHMRILASSVVIGETDDQGQYEVKNLDRGFLSITTDMNAVPAQYAFLTKIEQEVFILPNKTRTIDFRFGKYGHITGSIKAEGEIPQNSLKDIRVFVVGTDRDSLTDEDGSFGIADISPGKYIIKIDPDYVVPELEVVNGEASIEIKPGVKGAGVVFTVRQKQKPVEEKKF